MEVKVRTNVDGVRRTWCATGWSSHGDDCIHTGPRMTSIVVAELQSRMKGRKPDGKVDSSKNGKSQEVIQ